MSKFDFTANIRTNVAIPAVTDARSDVLPFKGMYTSLATQIVEKKAKDATQDVPFEFFTAPMPDGRGVAAEKVTHGYVRGKLREQFKAWVKQDEPNRSKYTLVLINRSGKEEDFKAMGPAVSVWLTVPEK